MAGAFITHFFEQRGPVHFKPNGEADVLCPFEHDKGFEQHSSAHINEGKAVFHCKTCRAEGRFKDGGLSEIGFVSKFYSMPYHEAAQFVSQFENNNLDESAWAEAQKFLHERPDLTEWLHNRGITDELIESAKLGSYDTGTICYPVFMNGVLLDVREYNPTWKQDGTPKIKSQKGASNLLFPFDLWDQDKPTLLAAGENDTLLARKWGFNALTSTFGEGNFPHMFLSLFSGKTVYIAQDCDEAGKTGALRTAFDLYEAGAFVYIVDLKIDKDITDIYHAYDDDGGKAYLQDRCTEAVAYDGEMYQATKDQHYPLVNLWEVHHAEWNSKHISSRVLMAGKYDQPMQAPVAVEWECFAPNPTSSVCQACSKNSKEGWWALGPDNLRQLLELVEQDDEPQIRALNRFIGIPAKCPGGVRRTVREVMHVQKVMFLPDVETEDELSGFRMVEHYGYVLNHDLEDGQRYRIFMKRFPHPRDGQAIVSVIDKVEESDNAVNRFTLTSDTMKQLSQFQGHPDKVMADRLSLARKVVAPSAPQAVVEAVNLMYHSVLDFKYAGKSMKGHPEGLIIGESRTGKTETFKNLKSFYQLGNITECKTATTAGLLGGADKAPSGGHRIKWGIIPRNHRGLLGLDELSGMPTGVMASLTALRSERIARIVKIESGAAPAKVRLLWISNPRVQSDGKSRPIALYPNGISIVLDLVGSDEDVARFDFMVVLPPNETYISPFTGEEWESIDNTPYRNLIHWVWSRRPDQVKWAPGVEEYVWQVAQELNERFDTSVKIFGPEAHKKIARIAVSVASMCFSHDGTGESILVRKDHVDWASAFLNRCYDNSIFRLAEYVEEQRQYSTTNEEINMVFANLAKSQPLLVKSLLAQSEVSLNQLQIISGLERTAFGDAISNLVRNGLIKATGPNVSPTLRMKKALDAYRLQAQKQSLTPLSQKGVMV